MSGDYSRWPFEPGRDYSAVLLQQGRILTDADWNEGISIVDRRLRAETVDALGRAVVPFETKDAFRILLPPSGGLAIGLGRAYVDGLLAENHGEPQDSWHPVLAERRGTKPLPYDEQPYLHDAPGLPAGGSHLVYLKVWQRELTHVEEPDLVEKALGVDTTTRLQTVWQVKVVTAAGAVDCGTPLESIAEFVDAEPSAAGRLSSDTADVKGEPDPCLVPPGGGYTGVENQLYRVEVHRGGTVGGAGGATFKWSRDDATVAARVSEIPSARDRIVVDRIGRDDVLRFHDGEWIEITDDWRELAGLPGEMRRIKVGGGVDEGTRTILLQSALPAGAFPVDSQGRTLPERNTRVRRWDQHGKVVDSDGTVLVDLDATAAGTIPVQAKTVAVLLEHGIVVTFDLEPAGGRFRTGDHWLFAARTVDSSVEQLDHAPPRGIHAHFAPLALVASPGSVTDCRTVFPPLGGLDALVYVAGDGQEVTPDLVNPVPIGLPIAPTVGVARGPLPVAGRTVRFRILDGSGTVDGAVGPVSKTTGGDGLASVDWVLDPATQLQRLVAELLDANGDTTSLPVGFSARLRTAAVVAYDPMVCPDLAGVRTVQAAIDKLCGQQEHGDCCATVGAGGEFPDIESAIQELAKRHDGHVCICLLPEHHKFGGDKIGGLQSLTIGGRGAVIDLVQPLRLVEILDVAVHDVALVEGEPGLDVMLEATGCGRTELAAISASAHEGKDGGTVLRFVGCTQVRVTACELANVAKPAPGGFVLRDRLPPMILELVDLAERTHQPEEARGQVDALLARPAAERAAAADELGLLVKEHGSELGARSVATLERVGAVVRDAEDLPPAALRDLFARIKRLGAVAIQGRAAIELRDSTADTWLTDNRIVGGVVLFGVAPSPATQQKFADIVEKTVLTAQDVPKVPAGTGQLRLSGNVLDWIALSEEVTQQVLDALSTASSDPFGKIPLFDEAHIHHNTFRGRTHVLAAETVTLGANSFEAGGAGYTGFLFGSAATATGNVGSGQDCVLVVAAGARGLASNVRITITP